MVANTPDAARDGAAAEDTEHKPASVSKRRYLLGLSGKLLLLTIIFVMVAEVLIFVPSVANFRRNWLSERLVAAQIASLAVEAAPNNVVPNRLRDELLRSAMVHAVALKRGNLRMLILQSEMPRTVDAHFDLRRPSALSLIGDALSVFVAPSNRMIRVIGQTDLSQDVIEIVMKERPLKAAMVTFALNILGLSIIISVITASLVYVALNALLVRPMTRITWNMVRFRENPEDRRRIIRPCARRDEIGMTEEELAAMQSELADMLQQKSRLASLGLAVSKINHDLRNMLSSAQLISDRLSAVPDQTVQKLLPKLIASLDRAITLCTETLRYGRAREAPPERRRFALLPLVQEVGESAGLVGHEAIGWRIDVDESLEIEADRGHLYRIVMNLVRNAMDILEGAGGGREGVIRITGRREGPSVIVTVSDNGPGVSAQARAHLFQAFQGSARKDGTGLGLAISAELVRAHGGDIRLEEAGPGTTFRVEIPDRDAPSPRDLHLVA